MAKKVELNGKKYKITTQDYGYTSQQLFINGKGSNIQMDNNSMDNITSWKIYVKKAIKEYEERLTAQKEFNDWNGKL